MPVPLHHAALARVMQSESGDWGRWRVRKVVESGEFAPNTARLTACRAGDIVAGSQKKRLNFLFAANRLMLGKAGNTEAGHLEFASDAPKLPN